MNTLFPYFKIQPVMVACLAGFFLSSGMASHLHAQTSIPAPDISNDVWLNSTPQQKMKDLRGKVVMVEFWTFGCYNCRNIEPYVKEWHAKDPRENNLTNIAPRFGPDLDETIEKNSRHSTAMVRVFRLRPVQRWPEGWMRD